MDRSKRYLTLISWWFVLTLTFVNAGPKRPSGDDNNEDLFPRPTRSKGKPELFADLPDPEPSAQQVTPTVSGFGGSQGNVLGNGQGLYGSGGAGFQNQGINPALLATQGLTPGYLGGTGGLGFQNPYLGGLGFQQQDLYNQQQAAFLAGFNSGNGGIYQQGGFGFGGTSTNPYLTSQGQNQYVNNPYGGFQGTTSYLGNTNLYQNPFLLSRGIGYPTGSIYNPYLAGSGNAFGNPYLNPYPLNTRFGLGRGGVVGSRTSSGSGSSSSSNDE